MAALPGGWVDCGRPGTYSGTGTISQMMAASSPFVASGLSSIIQDWTIADNSRASGAACPAGQAAGEYNLYVENGSLGVVSTRVYHEDFACTEVVGTGVKKFTDVAWVETRGPFRLGAKYELIGASTAPNFAKHYILRYHWFADRDTKRVSSCGGVTAPTQWMQSTGFFGPTQSATDFTPIDVGTSTGDLTFGATVVNLGVATEVQCRFTGLSVNGVTPDTSNLVNGCLRGSGSGNVTATYTGTPRTDSNTCAGPYRFTEEVDVPLFGGPTSGAEVTDVDGVTRTVPYTNEKAWYSTDWSGTTYLSTRALAIRSAWATAQNPALPTDDLTVLYQNPTPLLVDGSLYQPVTISLAEFVEVHRPGGVIPSLWVASDARITVTETMAETVITVHEEGAYVERTFAGTQNWRNHVGLGTGGTGHADFGIEEYEVYRHNYSGWGATGEDAWAWGTYAWLGYEIQAPDEHDLTLLATGLHLGITDTHESDLASRIANYVATPVAYNATYAVPVTEGTKVGRIDLLFPSETQPFYHGRVDALRLSGFKVGTYRIKRLRLEATGQAYFTVAFGKMVQRDDYSALVAAVNGAFVFGNWPDQAVKPDMTGDYGGGIRYVNIVTGTGTGIITDNHKPLEDFIGLLNKIEGWTGTWRQVAHNEALRDDWGNDLGTDLAQWLLPVVPYYRLTPGAAYSPEARVVSGQVQITTLLHFQLTGRQHLWGALEAQGKTTDGRRADAGVAVEAYRTDTGAVIALGETDEDGFTVTWPVPANGVVSVALRERT